MSSKGIWTRWAAMALLALMAPLAPAAEAALDRPALLALADGYIASWTTHNAATLSFAPQVRIVENLARIKPGEGLWKTASGTPTDYKLLAADTVRQQVAGLLILPSEGKPVQVGFRLKLAGRSIVEAEHLVVPIRDPANPFLQKLRPGFAMAVPYEYADSHGRLLYIAKSYYDALDNNNGHLAPFASDCERRENGMRTAPSGGPSLGGSMMPGAAPRPPGLLGMLDCTAQLDTGTFQYIASIDNRRVDVADTVTGVVVGFSHFHHPMTQTRFRLLNNPDRPESDMSNTKPFDLPAMHVYKIWGGQIHEIEAIGYTAPLNSPTGWE